MGLDNDDEIVAIDTRPIYCARGCRLTTSSPFSETADPDPERVVLVVRTFIDRAEREEEHELTVQAR
jgi:hypothetical protein